MSENGWREISDAGKRDALGRLSRAGSWWLALAVVCTVGLVAVGVLAFAGRPSPDPAAGPAAPSPHPATRGSAGAPATTPAGGVSPSAVPAGLISSPPPAAAPRPSPPRPAPSPQPSPSPVPSPPFVTLNPAGGPAALTPTPTWSASACPSGYQGSARLSEYTLAGTFISSISNVVGAVASPFSGQLLGTVGALLNFGGVTTAAPGTLRWTVGCYSGAAGTGSQTPAGTVYVTLSAAGSYTSSATPPG